MTVVVSLVFRTVSCTSAYKGDFLSLNRDTPGPGRTLSFPVMPCFAGDLCPPRKPKERPCQVDARQVTGGLSQRSRNECGMREILATRTSELLDRYRSCCRVEAPELQTPSKWLPRPVLPPGLAPRRAVADVTGNKLNNIRHLEPKEKTYMPSIVSPTSRPGTECYSAEEYCPPEATPRTWVYTSTAFYCTLCVRVTDTVSSELSRSLSLSNLHKSACRL